MRGSVVVSANEDTTASLMAIQTGRIHRQSGATTNTEGIDEDNSSPFSRAANVAKQRSDFNMIDIVAESPPQHEDGSSSDMNPLESAKVTDTTGMAAIEIAD